MASIRLSLLLFSLFILTASCLRPSNFPANGLPTKNIILKSSDGVFFEVNDTLISISETIKHVMEENGTVPLPDVDPRTLSKVIEYCNKHFEDADKFDSEFVRVDHQTLFSLFRAANYLKIQRLGDLIGRQDDDVENSGRDSPAF